MERALARGEISASADIATLSQVIPSMAAYRSLVQRKSFERAFLVSMVDGVILPALGIKPSPATKPRRLDEPSVERRSKHSTNKEKKS